MNGSLPYRMNQKSYLGEEADGRTLIQISYHMETNYLITLLKFMSSGRCNDIEEEQKRTYSNKKPGNQYPILPHSPACHNVRNRRIWACRYMEFKLSKNNDHKKSAFHIKREQNMRIFFSQFTGKSRKIKNMQFLDKLSPKIFAFSRKCNNSRRFRFSRFCWVNYSRFL